jgi:hypothetical protein
MNARRWFCPIDGRPLMVSGLTFLVVAISVGPILAQKPEGETPAPPPVTGERTMMEAVFVEGGSLRLQVHREALDLATPYGRLTIPFRDIRRIDFAQRVPEETSRQIEAAIKDLGSGEFRTREAAEAALRKLGARAYPALQRASRDADRETATRAAKILDDLRRELPRDQIEVSDRDVIYTLDSKLVGRIEGDEMWKAHTSQFGEVQLRLADLRHLALPGIKAEEDLKDAPPDPGALAAALGLQALSAGKTFSYRVTGKDDGVVWGSELYTVDSELAAAAVHAGILRAGQTGVVKVETAGVQPSFEGSERNGVTSFPFGRFPGFRFVKPQPARVR